MIPCFLNVQETQLSFKEKRACKKLQENKKTKIAFVKVLM